MLNERVGSPDWTATAREQPGRMTARIRSSAARRRTGLLRKREATSCLGVGMEFGEQADEGGHLFTDRIESIADGEEVGVLEVSGDRAFRGRVLLEYRAVHLTASVKCQVTHGAFDTALLVERAKREVTIELLQELLDLLEHMGWRSDPVGTGGFIREHF